MAGDLSCEHVIHAVGPNFHWMAPDDDPSGEVLLERAYERALLLAREKGLTIRGGSVEGL